MGKSTQVRYGIVIDWPTVALPIFRSEWEGEDLQLGRS